MTLCAPNETQDKGNLGQKDFKIMRKSTLVPRRIMVSNGSLSSLVTFSFVSHALPGYNISVSSPCFDLRVAAVKCH